MNPVSITINSTKITWAITLSWLLLCSADLFEALPTHRIDDVAAISIFSEQGGERCKRIHWILQKWLSNPPIQLRILLLKSYSMNHTATPCDWWLMIDDHNLRKKCSYWQSVHCGNDIIADRNENVIDRFSYSRHIRGLSILDNELLRWQRRGNQVDVFD